MKMDSSKPAILSYQSQTSHKSQFRQLHGGELKVETLPAGEAGMQGEGSAFIIQLPIA
jgi:hypothetical protein